MSAAPIGGISTLDRECSSASADRSFDAEEEVESEKTIVITASV